MCGINGFNFRDKKLIEGMNKTISHRGPDDNDTYLDSTYISLGHQRLSIIDLSSKAKQPMERSDLIITYNGELYNFEEIREQLEVRGVHFETTSDTEVIIEAYRIWKEKCLEKFNGMFALTIYDKKEKKLFLARDRFGKKPLYYYNKNNKFIFSSEIKAILKTGIKKEIDKEALEQIFTYRFTFGEKTILKDINNFLPGHYMVFDLKQNKIEKYEKYYELKVKPRNISLKDAMDECRYLISDSVEKRMLASDVPVATFLSGGIDSTIITYLAKKHNKNLNTFSIGFDTTNELNYAKIVAEHFKTNHHEFKIDKDSILDHIEQMVYHMDEPIGADPGFLPIFVLSNEVSKHNKVVLSGDGADEIFTGYDRYKLLHYGRHIKKLALTDFNNQILKRLSAMKNKNHFESFVEITRVFEEDELKKLKLKENIPKLGWDNSKLNLLTNAQIFDIENLLPKDFFMKADKMSSAFGLEQRVPFMDYRVVELGLSLPIKLRLKGWNEKYILKQAFKDVLPQEILKRRKHGFNVPIDYWFENTLGDALKTLLKENNHKLYNKSYALQLLKQLRQTKGGFKSKNVVAQKLWTILIFELWYKRFMD